MTTIWPHPSTFPVSYDNFSTALIDNVDEVIANHPNSLASGISALEQKLNLDNLPIIDTGGLNFDPTGHAATPAPPGIPSLWIDTSGGPFVGFPIKFTDQLGVTYDLRVSGGVAFIGTGFTCALGTAVGDMAYISAVDTVATADAVVGNQAHGMVISVYGGGTTCDIAYGSEITNGAWVLVPGATYYLGAAGGFGTAPPGGWTVQQEIGFARNVTTMVFRPTITTR